MAKRKTRKRTTKSARIQILADISAGRLTPKQAAKKAGVSIWAVYGWRKRGGGTAKLGKMKKPIAAKKATATRGPYHYASPAARAKILAAMKGGMTTRDAAKKHGVSVWTVYGWRKLGAREASRGAGKAVAKRPTAAKRATAKRAKRRTTRANRTAILAEMNSKGLTAKQIAKKHGLSPWTIYGWRKRTAAAKGTRKPARPAKGPRSSSSGISAGVLREEIRAVLPAILREELARAIAGMVGGGGTQTRRGHEQERSSTATSALRRVGIV